MYVSADKRNAEVIAFIPKASSSREVFEKSGAAFFVEWAKASAYDRVKEVVTRADAGGSDTSTAVGKGGIARSLRMVGPLAFVQWKQGSPYNNLLPLRTDVSDTRISAGCVATAICQSLTAIGFYPQLDLTIDGVKIDWDYLAENKRITGTDPQRKIDMVALLHKWVFQEVKSRAKYDSATGKYIGTDAIFDDAARFLNRYCKNFVRIPEDIFADRDYLKYDFNKIYESLDEYYSPVFIFGGGHAWLLDGYIITRKTTTTRATHDFSKRDLYWHANFGWEGECDGYYKVSSDTHLVFEVAGRKYSSGSLEIYPMLEMKSGSFKVTTN